MNVLIVGGGGTIGSATAAYLAWKDFEEYSEIKPSNFGFGA